MKYNRLTKKSDIIKDPFVFFGCEMQGHFRRQRDLSLIINKIKQCKKTGCLNWFGSSYLGYGQKSMWNHTKKKSYITKVTRWVLSQKEGRELKRNEFACHTCDNPKCVSPFHLYVGTPLSNSQDMMKRKGHYLQLDPTKNVRSKFSAEQIKSMRAQKKQGVSLSQLGKIFGTDGSNVSKICRGLRYKHIK